MHRLGVADRAVDVAAALAGEGRRVHVVAGGAQLGSDVRPAGAVVPGPVDEDVGAHRASSSRAMLSSVSCAIANAELAAGTPQ